MFKAIHTEKAPKAVGPYSPALQYGDMVFCSGQIGIDPKTGELVEGLEAQIKQVLHNLKVVLEASDSSIEHVVKTTIFVTDMKNYATVNEIYGEFFSDHKPARSTVEVSALPKNALVEIEAIAVIKEDIDMDHECACGRSCGCGGHEEMDPHEQNHDR